MLSSYRSHVFSYMAITKKKTLHTIGRFIDVVHSKLKGTQINLHIDESVTPIIQPKDTTSDETKVEKELDRLERADIIEKVYGPTEWVSPILLQTKRNTSDISLCVDMRLSNDEIKSTRHVIPTIEEVRHELNDAVFFSKIDLKNAYHQLELHPDSRDITTFVTHKGLRRYNRFNYGTCSATEVFHEEIRKNIADISGVMNIYDSVREHAGTREPGSQEPFDLCKKVCHAKLDIKK